MGYVSPLFARLAKQYGYDIEGFRHTIDNFFINHANNRHSTARTETARGNVAITNDDILNIAKVYESPDYIIFGTKTKTGNPAIVYAKNMGNATVFVEDVRSGKKELAAETIYKKSGAIDVSSKKEAPELYAHSDPRSVSIIDVKKEFVNQIANGELIFQATYHGSGAEKNAEKTSPKVKKQRRIIIDARGERDPVKYMGKYLAAGNMLATFLTDEKTLDAMQKSVLQRLTPAMARKDYAEVYRFGNEAARSCTETCKRLQVYMKKSRQQNQEQAKVFEEISMAD